MRKLLLLLIPIFLFSWIWSWDELYQLQDTKFDSLLAGKLKSDTLVTVVARCDTIRGLAALLFATASPCGAVSMSYNKFSYIDTIFPCSGTYSALGLPTNHWAKGWIDSLTTTYIIGAVAMADSLWSAGRYRTGNAFLRNDNDTFRTLVGDSLWLLTARCTTLTARHVNVDSLFASIARCTTLTARHGNIDSLWSLTARCSTVVSDSTRSNYFRAKDGTWINFRDNVGMELNDTTLWPKAADTTKIYGGTILLKNGANSTTITTSAAGNQTNFSASLYTGGSIYCAGANIMPNSDTLTSFGASTGRGRETWTLRLMLSDSAKKDTVSIRHSYDTLRITVDTVGNHPATTLLNTNLVLGGDSILFGIPIAGVPRAVMYWSTANNNVRISQNLISEGTLSGNLLGTAWAQYFIGGGDNTWFIRRSTTGDTLHLFLDSTQVVSIINSVRVKKDSLSSTVGCYTKWMSPTDTTLITPIKVQTDVFQGNIRTFAVAGVSDTVNVAKASVMSVNNPGPGAITIGGFIGGVAGQILHIYNCNAGDLIFEDDEATGNQDIKTPGGIDITITAEGGATLICDGSLWWIIGIAQ